MKKLIQIFILFLFVNISYSQSYYPNTNICIGTDTLSADYPFTTYWMDGRTQMLFTASELTANGGVPGNFMSISFYVKSVDTLTMNGFNIKMVNTTSTSLTDFETTPFDIVYSGTYKVQTTGWNTITFQQPFGWNGNDNIIIEICYDNNRWTQFSRVRSTLTPSMTVSSYLDLPTGNGCVDIVTATIRANRPNICFSLFPLTGVGNNNSSLPDKFELFQNYPNPFNPVTKIKYAVAKQSNVTLKVYDILGKEIYQPVNEVKHPGYYIVEFNASNLSSGIYYYKLQAGEFTDIKKMIVVK